MQSSIQPDPETSVSQVHSAVVYIPRRSRNRFAANCVELFHSEAGALAASEPEKKRFAARVLGPSKSSEGQYIYYLLEWL